VLNNYDEQKKMMQARLDIKTCETMLANIINLGTSCSPFESAVIVDKAKAKAASVSLIRSNSCTTGKRNEKVLSNN
jgi:hypothetical protein